MILNYDCEVDDNNKNVTETLTMRACIVISVLYSEEDPLSHEHYNLYIVIKIMVTVLTISTVILFMECQYFSLYIIFYLSK